jgi:hypothetical protein
MERLFNLFNKHGHITATTRSNDNDNGGALQQIASNKNGSMPQNASFSLYVVLSDAAEIDDGLEVVVAGGIRATSFIRQMHNEFRLARRGISARGYRVWYGYFASDFEDFIGLRYDGSDKRVSLLSGRRCLSSICDLRSEELVFIVDVTEAGRLGSPDLHLLMFSTNCGFSGPRSHRSTGSFYVSSASNIRINVVNSTGQKSTAR